MLGWRYLLLPAMSGGRSIQSRSELEAMHRNHASQDLLDIELAYILVLAVRL